MEIGKLLLRLAVGVFFVGHGTQKLFGWFGGHGLEQTAAGFEQMGLRPGRRNALAAGAAEASGGAALALGAATPAAATALIATMLTAIRSVHFKNGPWAANGGYEYNAVLIAAAAALAETGPGALSVDDALGLDWKGPRWALAALAAGVVGHLGAYALAKSHPPAGQPADQPSEPTREQPAGEQASA